MIKGVHAMFNATDAEAARAFLRDKLGLPCRDTGDGWLMFDLPEADVGCHPAERHTHEISFYTDDIESTVAELKAKGVETPPVEDRGWGLVTRVEVPGAGPVDLYQPKDAKG